MHLRHSDAETSRCRRCIDDSDTRRRIADMLSRCRVTADMLPRSCPCCCAVPLRAPPARPVGNRCGEDGGTLRQQAVVRRWAAVKSSE